MRQFMLTITLMWAMFFATTAVAFDFSKAGKEVVLPEQTSAVPNWVFVPAERGDTVWDYCTQFLRDKRVTGISAYQCSETAMDANGFTSWNDFKSIQIGQMVLLPSPDNDSALIQTRATLMGENPMGLASAIRRLAIADDAITARLVVLETTQLSRVDVEVLVKQVVASATSMGVGSNTLAAAIDGVNARIDGLTTGVTADVVSAMIADALLSANVPASSVSGAISDGLLSLNTRLTAVEVEQARLGDSLTATIARTAANEESLGNKVDTGTLAAAIDAVNARIDGLPVTVVTTGDGAKVVDERLAELGDSTFWNYFLLLMFFCFLVVFFLWWVLSKKEIEQALSAAVSKSDSALSTMGEAVTSVNNRVDKLDKTVEETVSVIDSRVKSLDKTVTAASEATNKVRIAVQKAGIKAETAHLLAQNNFDAIYGLMPQQAFPSLSELDAIKFGESLVLAFESQRKTHYLSIIRDTDGLAIEGLVGRKLVRVTDENSVFKTIRKAFSTAQAKENGSAAQAFSTAKAATAA